MIQMYFGKACKEYREEMNISQEKFALSIGMDRTYYSSVEAGKRNVSIQNIKKMRLLSVQIKKYGGEVLAVMNGRQALRLVPMERNARYVPVRE